MGSWAHIGCPFGAIVICAPVRQISKSQRKLPRPRDEIIPFMENIKGTAYLTAILPPTPPPTAAAIITTARIIRAMKSAREMPQIVLSRFFDSSPFPFTPQSKALLLATAYPPYGEVACEPGKLCLYR